MAREEMLGMQRQPAEFMKTELLPLVTPKSVLGELQPHCGRYIFVAGVGAFGFELLLVLVTVLTLAPSG